MPNELMEAYIRTPQQYVGAMAEFQATSLLNTDSLAQWVNDRVVVDEKSWTKIGNKSNPKTNCLYANYVDYCESANVKPLSLSKFSGALENLLQIQLGINAERKRDRDRGSGFTGIRLIGVDSIGQPDGFVSPETVSNALRGNHTHDTFTPLSPRDIQRLSILYETDSATFDKEIERLSEPQMEFFYQKISAAGGIR